jgi:hypothetical protein
LKFGFNDRQIENAVPVALVHLDTDVSNRELWFQMTRGDVEAVIERLTRVLQQMDVAEKLFPKPDSKVL